MQTSWSCLLTSFKFASPDVGMIALAYRMNCSINGVVYNSKGTSILQLWLGCIPVSPCNRQTSKISTFLVLRGFRLLKTKSSQTPFEQWSFHPGWLGYAGDERLPSYIGIIIDNYKSPYCPTSISWHALVGFDHCSFAFRFFPPGIQRISTVQKKIRRRSTERQGDFTGRNGLDAFTWPDREKNAQNPDRSCGGWVFGPWFHVALGCPVGS